MQPSRWQIECIGSYSDVSLWQVERAVGNGSVGLGTWGGSLAGNDAVIITQELRKRGFHARCHVLNPTVADMRLLEAVLGNDGVVAVGCEGGERTRSLCMEDLSGRRSWVFSRLPAPTTDLEGIGSDIVYVDCYVEFVEYLNAQLQRLRQDRKVLFLNLSTLTPSSDFPRLNVKPDVLQASISSAFGPEEITEVGSRLFESTRAERIFITMGARGAALVMRNATWQHASRLVVPKSVLGAGALFSAEIISGLLAGIDQRELLEQAVDRTASLLHVRTNDKGGCS